MIGPEAVHISSALQRVADLRHSGAIDRIGFAPCLTPTASLCVGHRRRLLEGAEAMRHQGALLREMQEFEYPSIVCLIWHGKF